LDKQLIEEQQQVITMDSLSLSSLGAHMIFSEIDEMTSIRTCEFLLKANMILDDANPITLFINSPGGSVTDGWSIIDVMKSSRIEIQTVALGLLASMAVLIFTAGQKGKRVITPNTAVMTHQFAAMLYGKSHELMAARKFHDRLEKQIVDHFIRYSTMNEKQIRDILLGPSDNWLEPKECIKYGLADIIKNPWDEDEPKKKKGKK
jgi:ATP-dependent Clp endopeptidase proteolytic subunit ClpP